MRLLFILIAVIFSLYFLLKKRYFDFFSLAFVSSIIYFLPGFFGYVLYPDPFGFAIIPIALIDDTYIVMILVLFGIFSGAFIYDHFLPQPKFTNLYIKGSSYALFIILGIGIIGFILTLLTVGDALFVGKKALYMTYFEQMRWQLVWGAGGSLAMVISYNYRQWLLFGISSFLMIFNLYIGNRTYFALAIISIGLIFMFDAGKQQVLSKSNIRKYWRQITIFLSLAYLFFLYKGIYQYVRRGYWDMIANLLTTPSFYLTVVTKSEPFITQSVLNEVLEQKFQVGLTHVVSNTISQLMIFSSILNVKDFNARFQPALFPTRIAGLAGNIWAEMWSSGGWILLLIFIIIYVIFLGIGSRLLFYQNNTLKGGVSLLFSYWAFYIHRNDISNQLSFEKQILLLLIFSFVLAYFIPVKRRIR